jgi:RNase P protein component
MSQRFTWKKAEKLKSRKRIERVFREGKSFSLFPYRVLFLLQPIGASAPAPQSGAAPASIAPVSPVNGSAPAAKAPRGDAPTPMAPDSPGAAASSTSQPGAAAKAPRSDWAPLQAGFGASSRHFKKAVDRNRIKRLGREAYRLQKEPLLRRLTEKGLSLAVFFIYTGKELPEHATVTEKIGVILQKLIKEIA